MGKKSIGIVHFEFHSFSWFLRGVLMSASLLALAACDSKGSDSVTSAGESVSDSSEAAVVIYPTLPPKSNKPIKEQEASLAGNPLKDVYFGDIHVHTSYSLPAYIAGTRLTPDDAYRFAKGETVSVNGESRRINVPLDFAAVTDYAEFLGEMYSIQVEGAPGYDDPSLVKLRELQSVEERQAWFDTNVATSLAGEKPQHLPFFAGVETSQKAWQAIVDAGELHYQPGYFTTLPGFEWGGGTNGANLHRHILFRDLKLPEQPLSAIESADEEELWQWIYEQIGKKSTLLAIPTGANTSKGTMFEPVENNGKPMSSLYAHTRRKYEPVTEIIQAAGDSEVVQSIWPDDEFADFENADSLQKINDRTFNKESFIRWAVVKGLHYEKSLGVNPYQLGFVGGSGNHNGLPGDVSEKMYNGSFGEQDNTVESRRTQAVADWGDARELNPGGLTGVWADKNTRAAIWDSIKVRETYATSGTRIKVRFFGGLELTPSPSDISTMVQEGYDKGVPMGGLLQGLPSSPTFTVQASKDPNGANLDRIQIIKGWVDGNGEPEFKIVNVAWSGKRKLDANGKLPPVGNTVDTAAATYKNSIGSADLIGSWVDDEFNPNQRALYYVRVLEIPTPRWTTYDAVRNNLPLLEDVPATVQERAWTSPIWYATPF